MVPLHVDYIITECSLSKDENSTFVQKDAFSFAQQKSNIVNNWSNKHTTTSRKKPNVLLLGIDSLSRINLRRTMPETFNYLQMNNWFELQGYNKVSFFYKNKFTKILKLTLSYIFHSKNAIHNEMKKKMKKVFSYRSNVF